MPDNGRTPARHGRPENLNPPVVEGQTGADHPAFKHGARSEAIRPIAARRKRTFLRRNGLRTRDLDPVGRSRVEQWARLSAQVELLDAYFAAHGLLKPNGQPQPATAFYVSLCNSLRLATDKLEAHVQARMEPSHVIEMQRLARRIP